MFFATADCLGSLVADLQAIYEAALGTTDEQLLGANGHAWVVALDEVARQRRRYSRESATEAFIQSQEPWTKRIEWAQE